MASTEIAEMNVKLQFDGKSLNASMNSVEKQTESTGAKIAKSFGGAFKTVAKVAVGSATAITGAIGGVIATGGFSRAMDVEQAEFKLKGLGHSAEAVDGIMTNALASVKGTAFGLGEAASVAASSVAAGIKPGQELERTLKLTADAAAIAGADMTEMGAIFNKVAANGKLSAEEMNQLADRGIPILQLLADTTGKTTDEVRKMVSEGKIGFAEFQTAIEKGMGGAALTMGQTFQGAVANVRAALSRLGESVLTPVTQTLTPALGMVIKLIDDVGAGAVDGIEERTAQIGNLLSKSLQQLVGDIKPILETIVPVVVSLFNEIVKILPELIGSLLPTILDAAGQIMVGLVNALPGLIQGIATLIPKLVNNLVDLLVEVADALVANLPAILDGLVDAIVSFFSAFYSPENQQKMLQAGLKLLLALVDALPDVLVALIDALPGIIDGIVSFLTNPENIGMIIEAAVKLFTGLVMAVPKILGALLGAFGKLVGNLWDGITKMFGEFAGNFGNFIGNIFKGAINGVIKFIENFINKPIKLINGFIDIINGAFGWLGVNIGKIGKVKLPRLAEGGIAMSATTAIIGEEGREAVIPLENNTGNWAGLLANRLAAEMEGQPAGESEPSMIVNFYDTTVRDDSDIEKITQGISQAMRRAA